MKTYLIVTRFAIPLPKSQGGGLGIIDDSFIISIKDGEQSMHETRNIARAKLQDKYSKEGEPFKHIFSIAVVGIDELEFHY